MIHSNSSPTDTSKRNNAEGTNFLARGYARRLDIVTRRSAGRTSVDRAGDEGAVAVMFALLVVVLFGFGAMAVDAGYGWAAKRQLSVTADASALAGAQAAVNELRRTGSASGVCAAADVAAGEVYAKNASDLGEIGSWPAWSWNPAAANPYTDVASTLCDVSSSAITVTVPVQRELATTLGRVLEEDKLEPGAVSTARAVVPLSYGGLRPFGMCEKDVLAASNDRESTHVTIFAGPGGGNEDDAACSDASGAWGGVNLDREGTTHCPSAGGSTFRDWIDNGYDGSISVPTSFCGHEGAQFTNPSFLDGLDPLIDEGTIILVPVVQTNSWQGNGGGYFESPGVMSIQLCGYVKGNGHGNTTGDCWDPSLVPEDLKANSMAMQWRYHDYVTSFASSGGGGTDESCPLTDLKCIPAVALWD